jgi:hypothetical protein
MMVMSALPPGSSASKRSPRKGRHGGDANIILSAVDYNLRLTLA